MAAWRKVKSLNNALFPQLVNVKQGRLGKLYNIVADYGDAVKQLFISGRKRPIRSFFYLSGIGSLSYLWTSNPNEISYIEKLVESSNEILLVSDALRSKKTNSYIRHLMDLNTRGCLYFQSFGFFTVALEAPFEKDLDLYEKHCYYVQPRWLSIDKRILDFGVFGYWLNLEKTMIDFDVNEDELPLGDDYHRKSVPELFWSRILERVASLRLSLGI